jgi:ketosteroid isomerase-like protein
MTSTKDVLEHHTRALRQGDLNAVLADYASDAVFLTRDGAFKGVDAIRPVFVAIVSEFSKPGMEVNRIQQLINGDYAYILWTAETVDNFYEMATDTFVVRDGKIVAQSFTAKVTPKSSL